MVRPVVQDVVARAARKRVGAILSVHGVVAAGTVDDVVAESSDQHVVTGGTSDHASAVGAANVFNIGMNVVVFRRLTVIGDIVQGDVSFGPPVADEVVSVTAADVVRALVAVDEVVARASEILVVARAEE